MTQEISNIVKGLVDNIDCTIDGVFDAQTMQVNVCKTKWARIGKIVTNSTNDEYIITDILVDEWIKVDKVIQSSPDLDGVITLPIPYWLAGTKIAANREWTIGDNIVMEKTPVIWMLELIRYTGYGRDSTLQFDSEIRLFILDETDVVNYYVEDHRQQVVLPMENLMLELMNTISKDRNFKKIDEYSVGTFSRFGLEKDNGMFQNILDANLSGLELKFRLVKYKENCKC